MGETFRRYWIPACSPRRSPSRTAHRCGCASSARTSSPSAIPPARSASSPPTARTAWRRSSTAATRSADCAASTTAGSSTPRATASTCPPSRRTPSSAAGLDQGLPGLRGGGVIWTYMGPRARCPPPPTTSGAPARRLPLRLQVRRALQLAAGDRGRHRHAHATLHRFEHDTDDHKQPATVHQGRSQPEARRRAGAGWPSSARRNGEPDSHYCRVTSASCRAHR